LGSALKDKVEDAVDVSLYTSLSGRLIPQASIDKSRVITSAKKKNRCDVSTTTTTAMGNSSKRKKEKQKDFTVRIAKSLMI
jgi:hypothetical protein